MDIKEKFKTFIDNKKVNFKISNSSHSIPQVNISQDDFAGKAAVLSYNQQREVVLDEHKLTPEAEKAVIGSIEPIYFEESGADVGDHELKKYSDIGDLHVLNGARSRLRKQQAVVNRCVSNLILQKQALCAKEINEISSIQREICNAINLCVISRSNLNVGRSQFTSSSLGILSNYSKRRNVAEVIKSLQTIRTLQMTDVELQDLLKADDYPGAINLLLEGQKAAATFKHFTCISELNSKLQDTLDLAVSQLDSALSKVSLNFNSALYERLVIAFNLLNKNQIMMDQLHMHLTSHIHNTAFNIILGYVELYNENTKNTLMNGNASLNPSYSKLQYSELCKYVNHESFLSCFLDLSKGMWVILRNYQRIIKWNNENHKMEKQNEKFSESKNNTDENYIKQKLDHGLTRLWQDVQAKVRTFILASDLSHFKFDDFLKILDVINKLIEVGVSFCGSHSETLQDSIRKQSFSFFQSYHSSRMEELHMILENEGWEICPVKSSFGINQLIEYKFLKGDFNSKRATPVSSPRKELAHEKKNLFDIYQEGTPFDVCNDESIEEDIMADEITENAFSDEDSDDEISEELRRDFVDEQAGENPVSIARKKKDLRKVPMITNTTLTILRLIGKYMQMMRLLQSIAFDVFVCLSQLFEYYMYSIFTLFTTRRTCEPYLSPQLRATVQRIEDKLILTQNNDTENSAVNKVPSPVIGPHILNDSPETLYNMPVRVIAVESLAYLSRQLESLQRQIESLLSSTNNTFLQQFYTNTVMMTAEVRSHVYMYVASMVVDYDNLLNQMSAVKWDINDFMDHHSSYVDILLRQLQILYMRIEELRRSHPIPVEAENSLWENVIRCVHRTMLEGFGSARKCSNEGRSLMQLDYQQFLMKVERLTSIRPLPDRHLVDAFVKAYYLPEKEIEEWVIANRNNYTPKQLVSLINSMTQVTKRTRQRIATMLEENYSVR